MVHGSAAIRRTGEGKICYGLYLWHVPVFLIMRLNLKLGEAWEWTVGIGMTLLLKDRTRSLIAQLESEHDWETLRQTH